MSVRTKALTARKYRSACGAWDPLAPTPDGRSVNQDYPLRGSQCAFNAVKSRIPEKTVTTGDSASTPRIGRLAAISTLAEKRDLEMTSGRD